MSVSIPRLRPSLLLSTVVLLAAAGFAAPTAAAPPGGGPSSAHGVAPDRGGHWDRDHQRRRGHHRDRHHGDRHHRDRDRRHGSHDRGLRDLLPPPPHEIVESLLGGLVWDVRGTWRSHGGRVDVRVGGPVSHVPGRYEPRHRGPHRHHDRCGHRYDRRIPQRHGWRNVDHRVRIPRGHLPPPGACRVWYPELPPGHQPPPTNCRAAEREAYRTGGLVVVGSRYR